MEIDDDLLAQAAGTLGTATPEETVARALRSLDERLLRIDAMHEMRRLAADGAFNVELHEAREAVNKALGEAFLGRERRDAA